MNCREARRQLESIRPDAADRDAPEFAGAANHLAECSRCRTHFEAAQQIDRRIGRVMRDVPVPDGLQSRLLASLRDPALALGDSSGEWPAAQDSQPAVDAPPPRKKTRVRVLAAVVAACAAAIVLTWIFWPPPPSVASPLSLADLRSDTTLDPSQLSQLSPFDGNFDARPPGGVWTRNPKITIDRRAKGDLERDGVHRVALFGFWIRGNNGRELPGVLLAIPKDRLGDPPADNLPTLDDRPQHYARRASGVWYSFAWTEGETVYVCFIRKRAGTLQMLQQAISGDPV